MDPEAALINMRDTIKSAKASLPWRSAECSSDQETIWALTEHFEALDGWMSRGGFLPEAWQS